MRVPGPRSARAGKTAQHLSYADRVARGKKARAVAPLESHAEFTPGGSRDPVGVLAGQAASRVPELVPVRHGRMLVSAFTFYRGAALPMAADLAATPASGLRVQLCGHAHLSKGRRKIVLAAAEGYRTAMRAFAEQPLLAVWYAHVDVAQALGEVRSELKAKRFKASRKLLAKAHTSDSTKALGKLTTMDGGQRRDEAIAGFAETYADQNERDYAAFLAAVKDGTVEAITGI